MANDSRPDADFPEIDVRKVIEDNTQKMSLRALEKRGFKNVRVLNEAIIQQLIRQAVEKTIESRIGGKGELRGSQSQIEADSRQELKRLMREHAESQETQSALTARADELRKHADALEDAVVRQKLELEREREAIFQRGVLSAQEQVRKLEQRVAELDAENAELAAAAGAPRRTGGAPAGGFPSTNLETMIRTVIESIKAHQDSDEITGLRSELKALAGRDQKMAEAMKQILREELSKRPAARGAAPGVPEEAFAKTSLESLFGEFGVTIESNIEQVETKEEKSSGIGDALDRLRKLKKGDKGE